MKRNAVAWAALVVSVAALVGSRSYTKPLPAAQDIPSEGQKVARDLSAAFNAVTEFVRPSVVQINVEKKGGNMLRRGFPGRGAPSPDGQPRQVDPKEMEEMLRRFFGPDGNFKFEEQQFAAEGTGSGFVFDDKGHVLTNNHVVEGADKITVTFHDGVHVPATLVGTFPEADVAVIKVENTEYRPVRIGSTKGLKVGEWVLAVGSPFGLSQSVTAGIVSATQRENVDINRFESFIQTDASINPGNSGGPLVDMDGRVIGINSAIATTTRASSGVGFAIPIDMAVRLANKLIQKGKIEPALMGVVVEPLTRGLARQFGIDPKTQGVVVVDIGPDTPAAKAGLQVGDVITTFDGEPVHNREGLQYLVTTSEIGQSYDLTYLRDGKDVKTKVSPASSAQIARIMDSRRGEEPRPAGRDEEEPSPAATVPVNAFGLAVAPLDDELKGRYGWKGQGQGLVVTAVKPDSPAAAAGLEVGDLITKYVKERSIHPAKEVGDFQQLVEKSDEVAIYVEDVNHRLPGEFKTLAKPEDAGK